MDQESLLKTEAIQIGQRIGNYRVVRALGQGGMGLVYEVVHEQIGRRAAIKVLRPRFCRDPHTVARLLNEARAVSRVSHPGLVNIFEAGQLDDGLFYLVMEYLEGVSLGEVLSPSSIDETKPEILRLFRLLASALAVAHRSGIIHRDIKPENVMVVADPDVPGGQRVKILDFGVAKLCSDEEEPGTKAGAVLGTPTYMAPEQCRGVGVDAKVDVYSLGIMLYEAVCGQPPFVGESPFDVMAMHVYEEPVTPEHHRRNLHKGLSTLILSMLAKHPEDRPTMESVADSLAELTNGPGSWITPPLAPRLQRPPQRSIVQALPSGKSLLSGLMTVGTSLCTAALVTSILNGRPAPTSLPIQAVTPVGASEGPQLGQVRPPPNKPLPAPSQEAPWGISAALHRVQVPMEPKGPLREPKNRGKSKLVRTAKPPQQPRLPRDDAFSTPAALPHLEEPPSAPPLVEDLLELNRHIPLLVNEDG